MADCLFCKIIDGQIPAKVVHRDELSIGFLDINPQAPTHILIVPKEHVKDISDLDASSGPLLAEMIEAANSLARSEGITGSGYRVVFNVGPDAGQSVFHLHLHLLGGRPMGWPPG